MRSSSCVIGLLCFARDLKIVLGNRKERAYTYKAFKYSATNITSGTFSNHLPDNFCYIMATISFKYSLFTWLYILVSITGASHAQNFRVDVHTHIFPAFYKQALLDAGFPTNAAGNVLTDGFPAPNFTIEGLVYERVKRGYNYSVLSISSPGVHFLKGQASKELARRLNDEMASYIRAYPKQLGAFGALPLPDVQASLDEIKVAIRPSNLRW